MHAEDILTQRLQAALRAAFGVDGEDMQLRPATKPEFGHFQTSIALQLAKTLSLPPRQVALSLVEHLDVEDLCLSPAVAGPGFVNLTLRPDFLAQEVNALLAHPRLGMETTSTPQRIVVDYSSPNVAKQMHVGHLRSTVIGDALVRLLTFAGHSVVKKNHVGDWGTQFGMLIEEVLAAGLDTSSLDLAALDALYRQARAHFEADEAFAEASRLRVVALQSGDEPTLAIWRELVEVSLLAFQEMYQRMGALLTPEDVAGESVYNHLLPQVVSDLDELGLLTSSGGAQCVFLPGFTARDGSPLPLIIQKADGGFGYDATDLAAIRSRVQVLHQGEGPGGCTADDDFFDLLSSWSMELDHRPVQFSGLHDRLHVYRR